MGGASFLANNGSDEPAYPPDAAHSINMPHASDAGVVSLRAFDTRLIPASMGLIEPASNAGLRSISACGESTRTSCEGPHETRIPPDMGAMSPSNIALMNAASLRGDIEAK